MNDNILDIMITIDVDTILNSEGQQFDNNVFHIQKTDSTKPTHLYDYTNSSGRLSTQAIYMVARRNETNQISEGTDELVVNVHEGDHIRWRTTSLSKGLDYAVLLYKYKQSDPPVTDTDLDHVQNVRAQVLDQTPLPIIDVNNPSGPPIAQVVRNFYWEGDAIRQGSITYTWAFMIVDRDNKVVGYCDWDPYINIS
ncbi:AidA/PixA family protein [Pseudomonas sp. PH1b]|uniref:AidA/PixA family protein n=1 Tax=Pseudomonas sp. PH1b TaxID=1397282 RepID=UPI000467F981|nr:AidA/PixA family protein [Pseudomonas sp. PH1b]BFD41617.1 hypothetical protein FFPRI1PSEUD_31160 [Pseudomonas sp. FFPRI_1]